MRAVVAPRISAALAAPGTGDAGGGVAGMRGRGAGRGRGVGAATAGAPGRAATTGAATDGAATAGAATPSASTRAGAPFAGRGCGLVAGRRTGGAGRSGMTDGAGGGATAGTVIGCSVGQADATRPVSTRRSEPTTDASNEPHSGHDRRPYGTTFAHSGHVTVRAAINTPR